MSLNNKEIYEYEALLQRVQDGDELSIMDQDRLYALEQKAAHPEHDDHEDEVVPYETDAYVREVR